MINFRDLDGTDRDLSSKAAALAYRNMGLNVLPLAGKRPRVRWKRWQSVPQTPGNVSHLFGLHPENGVAVITGSVSRNLCVLDIDTSDGIEKARRWPIFRHIQDRGTATVKTRRGYHLYIQTDKPARNGQLIVNGEKLGDIKAERGYVAAPWTVYGEDPEVNRYLFETYNKPLILPIEALAPMGILPVPFYDADHKGLNWRHYAILQGDKQDYKSKSEAEAAVILAFLKSNKSPAEIKAIFESVAGPESHYKQHGQRVQYLDRTIEKVWEYYRNNPRKFDKIILELRNNVQADPVLRETDRAVMLSALEIALNSGKGLNRWINLSARQLADLSGVHSVTVSRALHRLSDYGLIDHAGKAQYRDSASYTFLPDAYPKGFFQKSITPSQGTLPMVCIPIEKKSPMVCPPIEKKSLDVYRHRGIGKTGLRIIEYLSNQSDPVAVSEIIKDLKIAYNTVRRKLEVLGQIGKITYSEQKQNTGRPIKLVKLEPLSIDDLDRIAEIKGVKGTGERQRQRHKEEREAYDIYLAEKTRTEGK